MSTGTAEDIGRIYQDSPLPAAIAAKDGLEYTNPAFDKRFDKNNAVFASLHTGSSYERIIFCDNKPCKAYITPISESRSLVNISEGSVFEDYSQVLCAAVRHAVTTVCAAADSLSEICSDTEQTLLLNAIDGTMLTLLSEFLIPEELSLLRRSKPSDFGPASLSGALNELVSDLSEILARHPVNINASIPAGLYAAVDMNAIKLLLTDFAVKAMEGETYIETVSVSLLRHRVDGMLLKMSCGRLMKLTSKLDSRALPKPSDYSPCNELADIICEKFGCTVKYEDKPDFCTVSMEIPMAKAPVSNMLHSPVARYGRSIRFTAANAYLSRFGANPSYELHDGKINKN